MGCRHCVGFQGISPVLGIQRDDLLAILKRKEKKRKEMKLQLEETSENVSSFHGFYGKS